MAKTNTTNTRSINPELREVVGEGAVPLISMLKGNCALSEFELAKKTSTDINEIRTLLYRLQDINLVSFRREREKKSGWYIYYWSFNTSMIKPLLANVRKQKLLKLREELKRENSGSFFSCQKMCVRMDFETTTNCQYHCPECGGAVQLEDNIERVRKLKEGIIKLEKAIEAI
jgi:transcription initiation factor TFIIE subunit alpha